MYFHPQSSENNRLRQILTYFLQVYTRTKVENQTHMAHVFGEMFFDLVQAQKDEDGPYALQPMPMALQMLEWIDPARLIDKYVS